MYVVQQKKSIGWCMCKQQYGIMVAWSVSNVCLPLACICPSVYLFINALIQYILLKIYIKVNQVFFSFCIKFITHEWNLTILNQFIKPPTSTPQPPLPLLPTIIIIIRIISCHFICNTLYEMSLHLWSSIQIHATFSYSIKSDSYE